jgi:hypothetical protein
MAKIEDLIAQIPDERLKTAIGAEVRELKRKKKFGLVFEQHLPETVRLPKLRVKEGELVAKKRESGNELWRVKSIRKGIATLERAVEGYPLPSEKGVEALVAELVVVRSFGDPIYPALVPVDRVARGGPEKPWHMVINAENFHALQLLLYAYEGTVDAIYIDPPYSRWRLRSSSPPRDARGDPASQRRRRNAADLGRSNNVSHSTNSRLQARPRSFCTAPREEHAPALLARTCSAILNSIG